MPPANQNRRYYGSGTDAKPKGRPLPGSIFDDRILHGPGCSRCLRLTPILFPVCSLAAAIYVEASTCVFQASRNLSSDERSRPELPPPDSRSVRALIAQREDCAIPIVLMSSDRLFLGGLLASIARLRFTGTINLPCLFQRLTQTGHFYFALIRAEEASPPLEQEPLNYHGELTS